MTPTAAQRKGLNTSLKRAYDPRAQIAAKRQWILDSEMTAEQLRAHAAQLKAEFLARDAKRQEMSA